MPRRFTLAEARLLLPEVGRLLRHALALKADYADAEGAIQSMSSRIAVMGGMSVDRSTVRAARERRDAAAARLREALEAVQETGCLVKDLDIGLIDFPSLFRGREVYLCWKLDEPDIAFWHPVEEGFAGRKPIDRDFIDHHRGDRTQ